MSAGRVVALVFGSLILLVGIALAIGGGTIIGVDRAFTDAEGFLTAPPAALERDTFAIVGDLLLEGDWIWWWRHPTEARVRMTGDRPVFLAIGPRTDVDAYLSDVPHAEIEEIDFDEYRSDRVWATDYRDVVGSGEPSAPTDQTFWEASALGEGTQSLQWTIEPGDWTLVVMNADGSRGIDVDGTIGVEAPWLLGVGIGVLAAGVVLIALGLVLVLLVARGSRTAVPAVPTAPETPSGEYPVVITAEMDESLSPALWLVKWFLLIPHFIVLPFLWVGFAAS